MYGYPCARVPATLSSDERFLSSASLRYMIATFLLLGVVMKCGIGGVLVCLVRFLCGTLSLSGILVRTTLQVMNLEARPPERRGWPENMTLKSLEMSISMPMIFANDNRIRILVYPGTPRAHDLNHLVVCPPKWCRIQLVLGKVARNPL